MSPTKTFTHLIKQACRTQHREGDGFHGQILCCAVNQQMARQVIRRTPSHVFFNPISTAWPGYGGGKIAGCITLGFTLSTSKFGGNVKHVLHKHPVVLLPMAALIGAFAYGLPMSASLWLFPPTDGDSSAWTAFLLGFFGLFIVPRSAELSLTRPEFLILVFFVHGGVLGLLGGLVGVFVIQWKNASTRAIAYGWKCKVCGASNEAASSACSACWFPAIASAYEIEHAKSVGVSPAAPYTVK